MGEDGHKQFRVFLSFAFCFQLVPDIALLYQNYHHFGVV